MNVVRSTDGTVIDSVSDSYQPMSLVDAASRLSDDLVTGSIRKAMFHLGEQITASELLHLMDGLAAQYQASETPDDRIFALKVREVIVELDNVRP